MQGYLIYGSKMVLRDFVGDRNGINGAVTY